jgi:hypothetical protein
MSKRSQSARELRAYAESLGYRYDGQTSNGHTRWKSKTGRLVVTSPDQTYPRTRLNNELLLRRMALAQPVHKLCQKSASTSNDNLP